MDEIKAATDRLFSSVPYHEITLTSIAGQLSWTRANLYKYVATKEEIFLELCSDKMGLYFDAFLAAFPPDCGYSLKVWAEVWTCILTAHADYLRYSDILCTIVETNVSLERLTDYKRNYYTRLAQAARRLGQNLGLSLEDAYALLLAVHYHAVGLNGSCLHNPLVMQAIRSLEKEMDLPKTDFKENMKPFIYMNLAFYVGE